MVAKVIKIIHESITIPMLFVTNSTYFVTIYAKNPKTAIHLSPLLHDILT